MVLILVAVGEVVSPLSPTDGTKRFGENDLRSRSFTLNTPDQSPSSNAKKTRKLGTLYVCHLYTPYHYTEQSEQSTTSTLYTIIQSSLLPLHSLLLQSSLPPLHSLPLHRYSLSGIWVCYICRRFYLDVSAEVYESCTCTLIRPVHKSIRDLFWLIYNVTYFWSLLNVRLLHSIHDYWWQPTVLGIYRCWFQFAPVSQTGLGYAKFCGGISCVDSWFCCMLMVSVDEILPFDNWSKPELMLVV